MFRSLRCCLFLVGMLFCSCGSKPEPIYYIELPKDHGLKEQTDVRMNGVKVGHLERMAGDRAVFVPLDKEMGFDGGATWEIAVAGLLGDPFLVATPGSVGSRKLNFGETIKVSARAPGIENRSTDKMAKSLRELFLILEAMSKVPPAKREEATKAALEAIEKVSAQAEAEPDRK
jgi:ABC-type transporter Mla subunit MlaD